MSSVNRCHYTAADKAAAVALYNDRQASGSKKEAIAATGIPKATLLRWVAESEVEKESRGKGRKPSHTFSVDEANLLRQLRLKRGSINNAINAFLEHEKCSPETSRFLSSILERAAATESAPSWPPCLRQAVFISEEDEAAFRGDRSLNKYAPSITRGAFWTDAQGREVPLMAHDIWESDDMSANEPFRHVDPYTGETLIGRQILFTSERMSAAMIGLTLIGRDRDAYRAEDILDHLLDLIDVFGMPRLWRIERGVWESKGIDGVALDDARARSLGFEGERWKGRRIGGFDDLFRVDHMYSSNGKGGIEGAFNHFQNLTAHESLHIGRERGEFEEAAKQLRRAQAGMADAQAKFWEAGECANAMLTAAGENNSNPKERSMFGGRRLVPNDLLRANALPKRTLPESERWRFHPIKQLAVVQKGLLTCTVEKIKHTWPAFGDGITLDHGHRVVIAFHPHHPERGCQVINAEFGPRNRERWGIGQTLFVTAAMELAPQWDERPEGSRGDSEHPAKRWKGQVRREFRAIQAAGQSAPASKSHLADGRGRAATVESGFGDERAASTPQSTASGSPAPSTPSPRHTAPATSHRSTTPALADEDLRRLEEEAMKFL